MDKYKMKQIKQLMMLCLCVTLTFAQTKEENKQGDTSDTLEVFRAKNVQENRRFNEALTLFKERKYQEAYSAFDTLFDNYMDNLSLNYYLGRSAFEIGDYDSAMAAFDRFLIIQPQNLRVKLELARVYFKQKMFADAEHMFKEVLQSDLPIAVKKRVEQYLSALDKAQERSSFNAVISMALIRDSNGNSGSDDTTFNYTTLGSVTNTSKPELDTAHQEFVYFNHVYDIGLRKGYYVKNSLLLYNKQWSDIVDSDVQLITYSPKLSYAKGNYSYEAGLEFSRMWYDYKGYMYMYGTSYTGTFIASEKTRYGVSAKYRFKDYIQTSNDAKDAHSYELSANASNIHTNTFSSKLTATYAQDEHVRGSSNYVDYYYHKAAASLSQKVAKTLSLSYDVDYKVTEYEDKGLFDVTRQDKQFNASLTSNYQFASKWLLQGKFTYTNNDSNQAPYTYDKTIYTINFLRMF